METFRKRLKEKSKQFVVSLRFSLLSIFIFLFLTTIIIFITIFYYHLSETILRAALILMDRTASSVLNELDDQLEPVELASLFTTRNIKTGVIDTRNQQAMTNYMFNLLHRLTLVQEMYWGDTLGNYFFVERIPTGYVVQVIDKQANPPTNILTFYDPNRKVVSRTLLPVLYDPRGRAWYDLALKGKDTVWTPPFLYAVGPPYLGIAVASAALKEDGTPIGVFAIDVGLDYFSHYVAMQRVGERGEVYIIDKQGKVIASPKKETIQKDKLVGIESIGSAPLKTAFKIYQREGQDVFRFNQDGMDYLASFDPIPILADDQWVIAIVVPAVDFTKTIHRIETVYVVLILFIFIAGILIMSALVTRVVTPIKILAKETEKIKNFDLSRTQQIFSHIREVIDLSNAMESMRIGLRAFQKYVPASLVRQLIRAGADAEVGGIKRELPIFFSDIKDFTRIAEKSDTQDLIKQVNDYFETLSHIILDSKGTVDKFIGDSIMAFWGAPLSVTDPCQHAAHAALFGRDQLELLNEVWSNEGRPIFYTRMAIHFGEVIVGSIGSSERLNYTAIGDAVNIASRLVNVNKLYGTKILVTEAVYQQIKASYVLRLVDQVRLVGKEKKTSIYELLAEDRQSILFDIEEYNKEFLLGFKAYQARLWKPAIMHFERCLQIYPDDTVAHVFVNRCKEFELKPPSSSWDGVWRLIEK